MPATTAPTSNSTTNDRRNARPTMASSFEASSSSFLSAGSLLMARKLDQDLAESTTVVRPLPESDNERGGGVAADVSRRTWLRSRQRISADLRRRLRFRGSTRESSRGNLSPSERAGLRGNSSLTRAGLNLILFHSVNYGKNRAL